MPEIMNLSFYLHPSLFIPIPNCPFPNSELPSRQLPSRQMPAALTESGCLAVPAVVVTPWVSLPASNFGILELSKWEDIADIPQ